jgi:hypothetical protein
MHPQTTNPIQTPEEIDQLEQQLRLSLELRLELVAGRAAILARDLHEIYRHIGAQTLLCIQLQQGGEAKRAGQHSAGIPAGAAARERRFGPRVQKLLLELAEVGQEIRRLNTEQIVLINGSRRTLRMIANARASFSPIYARPAACSNSTASSLVESNVRSFEAKS